MESLSLTFAYSARSSHNPFGGEEHLGYFRVRLQIHIGGDGTHWIKEGAKPFPRYRFSVKNLLTYGLK